MMTPIRPYRYPTKRHQGLSSFSRLRDQRQSDFIVLKCPSLHTFPPEKLSMHLAT